MGSRIVGEPEQMDGRRGLAHAIMSVAVPGSPPRLDEDGAAIGLSFLDSALRLGHVRRLTERLTVTDHRVARRVTEVDVSLRMLDRSQRRAGVLAHELRGHALHLDVTGTSMWVPVARIARTTAAPVDVRDAAGVRLPVLTPHEAGELLASGLYRLLRSMLDTLPDAGNDSDLGRLLRGSHEALWLIQLAIMRLLTERRSPEAVPPEQPTAGTVEGHGARHRSLALRVLDKYEDDLTDYFELFDIALDNDLLIVALDADVDEHLLTYETPMHVDPDLPPRRRLERLLRSRSGGYHLEYRSHLPPGIPAYHLVVETEQGVDIRRMYLSTDCDARTAATLHADLTVLAHRLTTERRSPGDRGANKILELQMQTTLRDLAELVRRRRWECVQAGFRSPDERMLACTTLSRIAVGGDGVRTPDGTVDSSVLVHPLLSPDQLRQAAAELYAEELFVDLALENDPTTSRAHATWRGGGTTRGGAPVEVRAGMLLYDSTTTGPRIVRSYALAVAAAGYLLAVFLADRPWPFDGAAAQALSTITNADSVIAVLLLVPGFLYTRLALPDPHSVAGHLRALPRMIANACIAVVALLSALIAAGLPGPMIQLGFVVMIVVPVLGALLLLQPRRAVDVTAELVKVGAPRWLSARATDRLEPDVRFFSPLGRAR